jgi:hypothetical protein
MVTRRGFLGMLVGAAAAPAIVKAENLMKIFVPPEKKIIVGRGMTRVMCHIDEAAWGVTELGDSSANMFHMRQGLENFRKKLLNNSVSGAHMDRRVVHFDFGDSQIDLRQIGRYQTTMPTEKANGVLARWLTGTGRA